MSVFLFLGATKHLYNWLCLLVGRLVCLSVTHSFDDQHVAPIGLLGLVLSKFPEIVFKRATGFSPNSPAVACIWGIDSNNWPAFFQKCWSLQRNSMNDDWLGRWRPQKLQVVGAITSVWRFRIPLCGETEELYTERIQKVRKKRFYHFFSVSTTSSCSKRRQSRLSKRSEVKPWFRLRPSIGRTIVNHCTSSSRKRDTGYGNRQNINPPLSHCKRF